MLLSLTDARCIVPSASVTTRSTLSALTRFGYPKLPFQQTLVATVTQSAPAIGALLLYVEGTDDAGRFQSETTPLVPLAAKTTNYVYLSRVFETVTLAAYLGTFSAGSTIQLGVVNDLQRLNTGTIEHVAPGNLGWSTMRRMLISSNESQMVTLELYNRTRNARWIAQPGAVQFGYAEPGWNASVDKWGLVWAFVIDAETVVAPTYAQADIVLMIPQVDGQDPIGA